jgi:hypothetical protein
MEGNLINMALSEGFGYVLFVMLLFYILKKQDERDKKAEERESNYQKIIQEFTAKLPTIETGIQDIKEELKEMKK